MRNSGSMNPDIILQDEGLLPLDPARVERLIESIKEIGLINPITVEKRGGLVYVVAGRHRLAAIKKLKMESVRVMVVGSTTDPTKRSLDSRLAEIDENLIRGELSAAERALLTDERKRIYEERHPETKASAPQGGGRRRKNGSQVGTQTEPTDAFVDDTAKRTGRSRTAVARDATRAKELKDELPKAVRTSLDKGAELDALKKLKKLDRAAAADLITRAQAGEQVSAAKVLEDMDAAAAAAEAARQPAPRVDEQTQVDLGLLRSKWDQHMRALWRSATPLARRKFVAEIEDA